jgi:myo-inositol-1(or 4)-monophosphatase
MDFEKLCLQVVEISKTVGKYILEEQQMFDKSKIELKGRNDFVSYVDKTAELKFVDQLSKILPTAGFIAEEGTNSKKGEVYNWVIDPLDGTTNFVHGIPIFCTSVALLQNNELLVGVIFDPSRNEVFYAWKGGGAWLNFKRIYVTEENDFSKSFVVTGFPYEHDGKLNQNFEILKHLIENTAGIRRLGSAALDLAYVACGRFDVFYEYGLNAWDVAAGAIIVKEAGGEVTDFSSEYDFVFGKQILATNGKIHKEYIEILRGRL